MTGGGAQTPHGGPNESHDDADRQRCAFVVHGRVQGVGFRAFVAGAAAGFGVRGWVRNAVDGSVRGEAFAAAAAMREFLAAVERGPAWARVDRIETESLDLSIEPPSGFEVRPT